ncbi:hypothetical protein SCACP_02790 [Sporomusa carbonis]|uniref:type I-C CRISPR-associated protein Cas8c/Csd1 n=1 Tax=Sporomusa carbonis TaxID=3076075 RepID=UPI003A603D30
MILQALNEHYHRLIEDEKSGVAPPGYSSAKVSHVLVIDEKGNMVDVWQIADIKGKKTLPKTLLVPEQVTRTSGVSANILCDNAAYVVGLERTKHNKVGTSPEKYADFKKKNILFLTGIQSEEATAVKSFLEKWNPEIALSNPCLMQKLDDLLGGSNIVFKLDGAMRYVHEAPKIRDAWQLRAKDKSDDITAQCLITGDILPIARIHPLVKGVVGAQTSGAAVVSFNADAFTSYGKSQSFNAPVSKKAAFAYATALNYLIASTTNRVRISDTTIVFWADKKGGKAEETALAWSLDPVLVTSAEDAEKRHLDYSAVRQAKTILERAKSGVLVKDAVFDPGTRCYLLGLAPNAARLSVRFWQVSNFGEVLGKIAQHYKDMEIIGIRRFGGMIPPWQVLKAIAVQEDTKNIPPLLGGQFIKSILSGQMYPKTMYNLALNRCRTGGEHGGVTIIRAALIKAFLARNFRIQGQTEREAMITVGLNDDNANTAYQLGRLFSLLEKVQKDALGNQINATIRDRYFGAASATPASVFPLLLRLSRHHIAKSEYGNSSDRKIQDVMNRLDVFPSHLNLEDQGQFILGYYHQNQANYAKNEINQEEKKG